MLIQYPEPFPTQLFHIPATVKSNKLLVFIPGNPGICEYYTAYLDQIHKQVPEYTIICPSHAGFNPEVKINPKIYSLDDQIDHKVDLITSFIDDKELFQRESNSVIEMILMGHSVGAWVVQRLSNRLISLKRPDLQLNFVGLVTPTIYDIVKSQKGVYFSRISSWISLPVITPFFATVLNDYAPLSVKKRLLQFFIGSAPEHGVKATTTLISNPQIIKQCLTMAEEEMKTITIANESDLQFWANANNGIFKVWCFFVKNDHWVSNETRQSIIDTHKDVANVKFIVADDHEGYSNIDHAFCMNHSDRFANITVDVIKNY